MEGLFRFYMSLLVSSLFADVSLGANNQMNRGISVRDRINTIEQGIQNVKEIHQAISEGNATDVARKVINITSTRLTGEGLDSTKFSPATIEIISGVNDMINNNLTSTGQGKMFTTILTTFLAHGLISYATFGVVNPVSSTLLGNTGGKLLASLLTKTIASGATNLLEEQIEKLTQDGDSPIEAFNEIIDSLNDDGVYNNEPKVKLGCKLNDDYRKSFDLRTMFSGMKGAEWGSSSIEPMIFDDEKSLENFITDLNEMSASVMKSTTYNDLDQLIKFINAFKFQTKKNLESFYKSYKYKFRPLEDTAVFEMKLINMLKIKYPRTANHFYLVTAYMDAPEKYTDDVNSLGRDIPNDFFHGHVAGAIKISIKSTIDQRCGLILIDLTLGLEKPIILMEDNQYPHYDTTMRGFGKKINYRFAGPGNSYVLAYIHQELPNENKILSKHLYYVKKPYCSFLEVTFKPNLLIPVHGMLTRMPNGFKKAQVNFRILPKKLLGKDFYFNVVTFNANNAEGSGRQIPFESFSNNFTNLGEAERKDIKLAASGLGIPPDLLLGKLEAIKVLIFDDSELVEEIYNLNKKLNYVEVPATAAIVETPDLGKDGKPEDNLISRKGLRKMFSWAKSTISNTIARAMANEKRNNFRNATENQNEYVKKTHYTNTA
ncbi:hypothetical protein WDU94_014127 [Cyamophila willieti]